MSIEDDIEKYDPADTIVQYLGGKEHVAEVLDLSRSGVYYWMVGRDRGGAGGVISLKHIRRLLAYADENAIDLRAHDFVDSFRLKALMTEYIKPRARQTCALCLKGCHDPVAPFAAPWMLGAAKLGEHRRGRRKKKR